MSPYAGDMPAPELSPALGWVNTDRPLSLAGDLRGRVVLLWFFNARRVDCLHTLADVAWLLEKHGARAFNVVGVHSARFAAEADVESVRSAAQRLGLAFPVVVDDRFALWRKYGVEMWPTFVLIGPDGAVVGAATGEANRRLLDRYVTTLLSEHAAKGTLAAGPFVATGAPAKDTPLRFPGKVHARQPSVGRPGGLFIADSGHHRVVVAGFPDDAGVAALVDAYGGPGPGFRDGGPGEARFSNPQGMALDGERSVLYVADAGNHAVRAVDLAARRVTTLVGTGEVGEDRVGGRAGTGQPLASPWDVALEPGGHRLLVACAGAHQVWVVETATRIARALAGAGREGVADGEGLKSLFAQPSGIAVGSDGRSAYVADAQGSAVRRIDLGSRAVTTLIGHRFDARAVEAVYGDVDGPVAAARLQHAMGVSVWKTSVMDASGDELLVADTLNGLVKRVDLRGGTVARWGHLPRLAEPGGLCLAQPVPGERRSPRLFVAETGAHRVVQMGVEGGGWVEVVVG